jgi:hypothetical protein
MTKHDAGAKNILVHDLWHRNSDFPSQRVFAFADHEEDGVLLHQDVIVKTQSQTQVWGAWQTVYGNVGDRQVNGLWGSPVGNVLFVGFKRYKDGLGSDDCATATPISGYGLFNFKNKDATTGVQGQNGGIHCGSGPFPIEDDVWFAWTATSSGAVTVQTCHETGVDTRLAAYAGSDCPPVLFANPLACSNDFCGEQSAITFTATEGSIYMIQVGNTPGEAGGSGRINISGSNTYDDDLDLAILEEDESGTWTRTLLENLIGVSGPRPPSDQRRAVDEVCASPMWAKECWVGLRTPEGEPKIVHVLPDGTIVDISGPTSGGNHLRDLNVVNAIAVEPFNPLNIYVGTDQGMFHTANGGETWEPFMEGLPVCKAQDLTWVHDESLGNEHRLALGTWGRGMWTRTVNSKPIVFVDKGFSAHSLSSNGTFENPFTTVADGIAAAAPGSILAVRGATYYEPQIISKRLLLVTWEKRTIIK